jgi:hypothetical protein
MKVDPGSNEAAATAQLPGRRQEVDIIRVGLTWGILLFHTCAVYAPALQWYVASFGWLPGTGYIYFTWVIFMDVWQMPMFFFLSGISAYFSLFRRTEQQFRDERVHRLLVPFLTLALLNGAYSVSWLAPRTPFCEAFFHGQNMTNNSLPWSHCETFWKRTENTTYPQVTRNPLCHTPLTLFLQYLLEHYLGPPNSGQGWFLLYLFLYQQLLAHLLVLWHPANAGPTLPCCGSRPACCARPPSLLLRAISCAHFFGRAAAGPEQLVAAARWWLGGTLRLGLLPGLWIALPEMLRPWLPGQLGNPFIDIANNFNYIFIFLFGYAITAADEHGLREVARRGRWVYLAGLQKCLYRTSASIWDLLVHYEIT